MKAKFKPQPGKFLSASSSVPDKSQGDSLPVPGTETAGDRLGQGEFPPLKKWAPSRGFLFTLRACVWATVCKVYFNLQFLALYLFLTVCVLPACMFVHCMYDCTLHVCLCTACLVPMDAEDSVNPLELELQTLVSHHIGAGTQPGPLLMLLTSHHSNP